MPDLPIDKLANAYVPDALPAAPGVKERMREKQLAHQFGGLWVGGRIAITPQALAFHPSPRYAKLHVDLREIRIALADIRAVRREFGWISGIVVVEHAGGVFRFRCFGARGVAARIARHLASH